MKKIIALSIASLIVLVTLSFSVNAFIQHQQRTTPVQGTASSVLEGTVLDSQDEPIEGAFVRVFGGHINFGDLEFAIVLDKNYTNADGFYNVDVTAGSFTILVTYEGYLPGFRYTVISPGETQIEDFNLMKIGYSLPQELLPQEQQQRQLPMQR